MRLKTQHATIDRGTNILNIEVPDQLKQRCKTDRVARTCLEWFAVIAKNRSKTDVRQLNVVVAPQPCSIEQLVKMLVLAVVHNAKCGICV